MTNATTNRPTQKSRVLNHLKAHGSITHVEANAVYKIPRLAARIGELRDQGWNIESDVRTDGNGDKYTRYILRKPHHPLIHAVNNGRTMTPVIVSNLTDGRMSFREAAAFLEDNNVHITYNYDLTTFSKA